MKLLFNKKIFHISEASFVQWERKFLFNLNWAEATSMILCFFIDFFSSLSPPLLCSFTCFSSIRLKYFIIALVAREDNKLIMIKRSKRLKRKRNSKATKRVELNWEYIYSCEKSLWFFSSCVSRLRIKWDYML